jgi:PAS domain S-box-containing protein
MVLAADLVMLGILAVFLRKAKDVANRMARQHRALEDSEARHRTILDNTTDALLALDATGRIVDANTAAERLFKLSSRDGDRLRLVDLLADPGQIGWDEQRAPLPTRGTAIIAQSFDGTRFDADLALAEMPLDGGSGYVAVVRDLSDRRRTEATLDLVATAMVVVDRERRLLLANDSGKRLLAEGGALQLRDGVVEATIGGGEELLAAIGAAQSGAMGTVLLPRFGKRPMVARISVLQAAQAGPGEPPVVIAVNREEAGADIAPALLIQTFRLTPAEARLVAELVTGKGLPELAVEFGLSVSTLRNQLKSVFRKTGTSRQSELVSRVLSSAVPLSQEPLAS